MSNSRKATKKSDVVPEEMLEVISKTYKPSSRLQEKVAIITGGDSGIGRSVAVLFAAEGASVAIIYLKSDDDAAETKRMVEEKGGGCRLYKGDIRSETFCRRTVRKVKKDFGKIDIVVNNAGTHEPDNDFEKISSEQFRKTFEVNIFSFFFFSQEAAPLLEKNGCIINTASVVAYRGSEHLIDYSATKGAIVSFTRSLAKNLAENNIRVNAVAPGPVWTPLVISSFDKEHLKNFGKDTPMKRAGKPSEIAPAYVFLASDDASFITGQVIHVNGGEVVGG